MLKNLLSKSKAFFLVLLPVLLHVKFSMVGGVPAISFPDFASVFPDVPTFAATALYWLEIIIRFVPSFDNLSLVSLLHDFLSAIVPNRARTAEGELGEHVHELVIKTKPGAGGTGVAVA
jgi:hypothetical protein